MSELRAYDQYPIGHGVCTVLPNMDFETYSEAGYKFVKGRWQATQGKGKQGGIARVGAWVYSEHPSTEVLYLAYNLKDGRGPQRWVPGMSPPTDLFKWITGGGLIEAHNSFFEYCIWTCVCIPKLGWPPIQLLQLRDSAAKCGAFSLPRALAKASAALGTAPKDAAGHAVMLKLSKPRNPTKTNPDTRWVPETAPEKFAALYAYGDQDIIAESDLSAHLPDLIPQELDLWKIDQEINLRGVYVDRELVDAAAAIIQQAFIKYTAELVMLTRGLVHAASEVSKIQSWLAACGYPSHGMEDATLKDMLELANLPAHVRRVIEIRRLIGSAAVKKVSAMQDRMGRDGRIRDMFMFCGAGRTGRWGGGGPQPHNMFAGGPQVAKCLECGTIHIATCPRCPECDGHTKSMDWCAEAMEAVVPAILSRDLRVVEALWGDALLAVSGCLRGMFRAAPGHELICSDYSAIEAVVIAALAKEEWRLEVFRTHGKIYEMSASKITGIPFEEFLKHKEETGQHHPMRKKVGKVAELASGFGGGVGAWKKFGADEFMTDEEIQQKVSAWRAASPKVVALWHGLENAAHSAMNCVGHQFMYEGIIYWVQDAVLYCRLLSGRHLAYLRPELRPGLTPWGSETMVLSFEGVMTFRVGFSGGGHWTRLDTWYGQLVENVVQATARDILAYAIIQLTAAGYLIVLHVHDEIIAEAPVGTGSIEEFECIMGAVPPWAAGWPIKAAGGWRGVRYRKD